jgi:hypothetical protein
MPILFTKDMFSKLRHLHHLKVGILICMVLGSVILMCFGLPRNLVAAQQVETAPPCATTTVAAGAPYITVTYTEAINVRTGPNSVDYQVICKLPVGGKATAVGRSIASEWIQIVYPDTPRGTAWVYAANVDLSPPGFLLPIVEPPPTPSPLVTATLNPTFVAAFQISPTSTHLPTFTPPASLVFPTYTNPASQSSGRAITTWVFVVLGLLGIVGLAITFFQRH